MDLPDRFRAGGDILRNLAGDVSAGECNVALPALVSFTGAGSGWVALRADAAVLMRNELRVLRAKHDLTQAELADKLGVSRQTVNAIETGKYDPSLPLAFKIARVFGETVERIFFDEESAAEEARDARQTVNLP